MRIRKDETQEFQNGESCVVRVYDFAFEGLGLATAEIDGRYPDEGRMVNDACDEVYFVQSGSGMVHHASGDHPLEEGDLFFFEKGKPYWVEGKILSLVVCTAPPWYPEQHRQLP